MDERQAVVGGADVQDVVTWCKQLAQGRAAGIVGGADEQDVVVAATLGCKHLPLTEFVLVVVAADDRRRPRCRHRRRCSATVAAARSTVMACSRRTD